MLYKQRRLTKNDLPLIKAKARELAHIYSVEDVKKSLSLFKGNIVYGKYDPLTGELIGWVIYDKTGNKLDEMPKQTVVLDEFADAITPRQDFSDAMPISNTHSMNATQQNAYQVQTDRKVQYQVPNIQVQHQQSDYPVQQSYPAGQEYHDDCQNDTYDNTDQYASMNPVLKQQDHKKQKKKHPIVKVGVTLIALVAIAGIGFAGYKAINGVNDTMNNIAESTKFDYSQYTQADKNALVHITVPAGATAEDVRLSLCQSGMVSCAQDLLQALDDSDNRGNIKQGTYIVLGSETGKQFAARLASGKFVPQGVIGINDGDTLDMIAEDINSSGVDTVKADEFKTLTGEGAIDHYRTQYSMLADVPNNVPSLEGYITTGEYNITAYGNTEALVKALLDKMQSQYEKSGKTSHEWFEILTKASMIDKEALFDEDRAKIASVINNRLAKGMNLQIDATVKYANKSTDARVLNSDLEVDSPYNTYKYAGLPIGPICSGITQKSIDAVISPEQTDYLYYVLADKEGHHKFSNNAEQFEQDRQEYLRLFGYTD